MNDLPQILRALAQSLLLTADSLAKPTAPVNAVEPATPAPVAHTPKKERAAKAKPAPVASDDDDEAPTPSAAKPVVYADDEDDAPKAKPAPVASDDDDEDAAPVAKPAPVAAKVDFAKLRAEAAALLVAYVDEHGMSKAAKVLRKHGADKVSKVADVSLAALVADLNAGEG